MERPLRAVHTLTKLKTIEYQVFLVRRASFGQYGLISDIHINFRKPRNGFNNHKGLENYVNCAVVKYG